MSRTITLGQLRAAVCARGDITDGGTTGRHTTAQLNGYINDAIQEFRRLVTDCGVTWYIKQVAVSTSTSATPDAANWAPRDYLAMPADFYHLEGIDITTGGTTAPMLDFVQYERDVFKLAPAWLSNGGMGMPILYKLGGYNAANALVAKIIPSADGVYSCVIWYLPIATDLVIDADTFDDIAGYDKWIITRAAMDTMTRDGASQPTYQALAAENARLEQAMRFQFASAAGPGHRTDTRALKARLVQLSRGDWRIA